MTKEQYRNELIRRVRCIGESLIKNAESIVGTEKNICDISISANASGRDNIPIIRVEKEFLPERYSDLSFIDENGEYNEVQI